MIQETMEFHEERHLERQPEIWAVGGGKGGTGKTFITCQLATCLAGKGKKVVLIDADFGGANVHSFFGKGRPPKTISLFFDQKQSLENLVLETDIPNLSIVAGNSNTISPSNIKYAQKVKLIRHIKNLDADYILLDLGGGTTLDTIDFFLLADKLAVVAVPEISAIENLYQFIKSAYFRKLKSLFAIYGLKEIAGKVWTNRQEYGIKNIIDLLNYLKKDSDSIDQILSKEMDDFSINVILNKVRNVREVQEGFSIRSICIKYIGVAAQYVGYVEHDFQFWRNLSLIQSAPRFIVSHSTQNDAKRIAENIMNDEQMKIDSLKNV